ncbi:MAG TPA: 4-hydroxy-3-methylbut-2-enyl diphosphate reductase, partial [Acidobacteriaceae bacterium]
MTSYPIESPSAEPISNVPTATKRVMLLKPRGFCAGVVRAVDIVRIALETFGAPI